jgi:hypothetical protein
MNATNEQISMTAQNIVDALKAHKGTHKGLCWRRKVKTLKVCTATIEKETRAYVRAGINYANLASVKDGIASGERGEVQPLPWGTWAQFPFIITHTPKNGVLTEYVRLYPATFDNLTDAIRVKYYMNGVEVKYQDIEQFLLGSEKRSDEDEKPECFTIKAQDLRWVD